LGDSVVCEPQQNGVLKTPSFKEKKKRKMANNLDIHPICVGTRCKETLKTVKQHKVGEKGEEVQWRG
jgi:hypothetical protein